MKTFLKITAITLPLFLSAPSFAHVNWGIDIRFGTPPPPRHEIIVERPYPDAIWVPGYYNTYPGHRYGWVPGFWRRQERFEDHRGNWGHERFERRDGDRDRHESRREGDGDRHDSRQGGDRGQGGDRHDVQRGRIH